MTKEDILSLAQHCWPSDKRMWSVDADLPRLERFAALVAEKERDAICSAETLKAANISGADLPHQVYEKYTAAIRARGNK
jgi:hypothetical protein